MDVAASLGRSNAEIDAALAALPGGSIESDGFGNVTEFGGPGLEPSPHRFTVRGKTLCTWFALDSLFIPEIFGEPVKIVSRAPLSGEEVRIELNENGTLEAQPAAR